MFATPAVAGNECYVASCAGSVYDLDVATGAVHWRYDTRRDGPPANVHGDLLLAGDSLVVAGDKEPTADLYVFDRRDGTVRWKRRFDGGIQVDVLRHGDDLLAMTRRGDAVALELAGGRSRWTYTGGPRQVERPPGRPALVGGRFVFPTRQGEVIALDASTGRVAWQAFLPAGLSTGLAEVGGALVVGAANGRLYRLDAQTGAVLGRLDVGGRPGGTPVAVDGCLAVVCGPDALTCVDDELGGVRWRSRASAGWSSMRPLARGGEVIAGTRDGELVAFDAQGRESWRLRLHGEIRGLGDAGDLILVGTRAGDLFAVRPPQPAPPR